MAAKTKPVTKKKVASKAKPVAKRPQPPVAEAKPTNSQTVCVLVATFVVLSVVFAIVAFWRYV